MRAYHLALAVCAVFGAYPARAVVLCAKQRPDGTFNSSVKIREACRASEVALDPVALGLQGPPGPEGPAGASGAGVVRDQIGAFVGNVVGQSIEGTTVFRYVGPLAVAFRIGRNGLSSRIDGGFAAFESADCSGAPWLQPLRYPEPNPVLVEASAISGTTLFYRTSNTTLNVHLRSLAQSQPEVVADCSTYGGTLVNGACCLPVDQMVDYLPAASIDWSALGLVPPFEVEAP